MELRACHCLNWKTYEFEVLVKMLVKIVRREDPIELYYILFYFYYKIIKRIFLFKNNYMSIRKCGSLGGEPTYY